MNILLANTNMNIVGPVSSLTIWNWFYNLSQLSMLSVRQQ